MFASFAATIARLEAVLHERGSEPLRIFATENEFRKDFTTSERVEIGRALEAELQGRVGNPSLKSIPENFPELPKGDTRDLAAKAAGFGNGKTYATRLHSNSISRLALLTLAIDSIS